MRFTYIYRRARALAKQNTVPVDEKLSAEPCRTGSGHNGGAVVVVVALSSRVLPDQNP